MYARTSITGPALGVGSVRPRNLSRSKLVFDASRTTAVTQARLDARIERGRDGVAELECRLLGRQESLCCVMLSYIPLPTQ